MGCGLNPLRDFQAASVLRGIVAFALSLWDVKGLAPHPKVAREWLLGGKGWGQGSGKSLGTRT